MPRFAMGKKSAERGPMTIFGVFACNARSQTACLCASVWREWVTSTSSWNTCLNSSSVCDVSAISGTRIIEEKPYLNNFFVHSMYTSVFPDPVTPWSRWVVDVLSMIVSIAFCWPDVGFFSIETLTVLCSSGVFFWRFFVIPLGNSVFSVLERWVW